MVTPDKIKTIVAEQLGVKEEEVTESVELVKKLF